MSIRPIDVLHVIYKVQPTNGQYNEHCLPLADARDITVCSFRPSELPIPPDLRPSVGDGSILSGLRAMADALDSSEHDVIHVHAAQTAALLLAVLAIRRRWRLRVRAVYTIQNSFGNYRLRNKVLMAISLPFYPNVVFCSRAARDSVPRWFAPLLRGHAHVVANCVDLDGIDDALADHRPPVVPRRPDSFRVVVVGRLMPIKDISTVVRAMACWDHPTADLVIVGDGPMRTELETEADRVGLHDRVTFTGVLERADVYRQLATADVVVSASHGEGLPVAVIEALGARRPVILSDIAPHRELAEGFDGIRHFPMNDIEALTEALRHIERCGPDERRALGHAGRAHVEAHFSLAAMHHRYEPIYAAARPTIDSTAPGIGGPRSAR